MQMWLVWGSLPPVWTFFSPVWYPSTDWAMEPSNYITDWGDLIIREVGKVSKESILMSSTNFFATIWLNINLYSFFLDNWRQNFFERPTFVILDAVSLIFLLLIVRSTGRLLVLFVFMVVSCLMVLDLLFIWVAFAPTWLVSRVHDSCCLWHFHWLYQLYNRGRSSSIPRTKKYTCGVWWPMVLFLLIVLYDASMGYVINMIHHPDALTVSAKSSFSLPLTVWLWLHGSNKVDKSNHILRVEIDNGHGPVAKSARVPSYSTE